MTIQPLSAQVQPSDIAPECARPRAQQCPIAPLYGASSDSAQPRPLRTFAAAGDGSIPPERLAANTTLSEKQKIAEASRQFEAILLRQILEAGQRSVIKSAYSDTSSVSTVYRDMVTTQMADSISKSGALGLAACFEAQLTKASTPPEQGTGTTKE
jgi:hypothetical protein